MCQNDLWFARISMYFFHKRPNLSKCSGDPERIRNYYFKKCMFQHEDLTSLTVLQVYNSVHFFFQEIHYFIKVRGKSPSFFAYRNSSKDQ